MEKLHIKGKILWRVFFNTSKKSTAEKLRRRLLNLFNDIEIGVFEQYWKDKTKFELSFSETFICSNSKEFIFIILNKISQISINWHMTIPENLELNYADIEGICNEKIKIEGINWIHFASIEN